MTGRCSLILGKNETWESAANLARELQGQEDVVLVMVGLLTRGKLLLKVPVGIFVKTKDAVGFNFPIVCHRGYDDWIALSRPRILSLTKRSADSLMPHAVPRL